MYLPGDRQKDQQKKLHYPSSNEKLDHKLFNQIVYLEILIDKRTHV